MKKIITLLILLATFSRSALYSQDTCTSTRYYSSGVIPSEFTKYGRIIAGTNTTGGPAVSNNPNQTTNLRAANYINLVGEFSAIATVGADFNAVINSCPQPPFVGSGSIYQQQLDYFLQYLDKSQIPTGILYDRVPQLADLDTLSNIIHNNTNPDIKTSYNHFLQAWQELYNASYNQSNILKPQWFDNLITEKKIANIIPIGVLNYRFNILDSLSLQNNLLYQTSDTMLHDVQGRTQLPYVNKEIFLATPLIDHVRPGAITFQFSQNTLLQNNPVTVNSLTIDFGEGQTATLTPDGSVTIQIQQTGLRTLTVTANFSNGTQKIIRAILEVDDTGGGGGTLNRLSSNAAEPPCLSKTMQADIAFADYNTGENKKGEIDAAYYFANCADRTLRKPIIILDGFDPGDDRQIPAIYNLLNYTNSNGGKVNFGDEMRQAGYDVIIVNFPKVLQGFLHPFPYWPQYTIPDFRDGGADYMERNAMVIVKLLDSINMVLRNNGSFEKTVLVGPSMGGLISRYALAYMEKNGINHNCKLWVSLDAPHLGANIPIGDQWWLEYYARVAGKEGAINSLDNKIGSVAAKQLLLDHWLAHPSGTPLTPVPTPFRLQFLENLKNNGTPGSNGYPVNLRKVAVTNGSGSGIVQPEGTACGKVLHLDGYIRSWVRFLFGSTGMALVRHHVTESNIYLTSNYGNVCKVFDGKYHLMRWSGSKFEEKYAQTPSYTASYDIIPGGRFGTQKVIKEEGEKSGWFLKLASNTKFSNVVNNHAFIPTVSALALKDFGTRDWAENLSTRNLVCTGETPFNAYFTPVNNEDHVFLTSANVDWIKNELNRLPQPSPYTIQLASGNEPICESTATYQVTNLQAGATVTWSTPSANISINPTTGSQTTVTKISTDNSTATLIATVNTCTGTEISTRSLRIGGYSSSDYPVSGPSSACTNSDVYFNTNTLPGATNYQWFWPSDWTYVSGQGTPYLALRTGYRNDPGTVGLRVANQCDAGGSPYLKTVELNDYYCGYYYYSMSPNPATSTVNVSAKETTPKGEKIKKSITEINIYDQQGNLKKHQKFGKVNKATINISDLRTGVYFVEIVDDTYKERQQLSILR